MYAYITTTSEDAKTYTVVSVSAWSIPNNYTLTITIEADGDHGKVTAIAFTADGNGFVPQGPSEANANILATSLVGATLADIDGKYDSDKVIGASNSAKIITAAVKAALTHFDANLASND